MLANYYSLAAYRLLGSPILFSGQKMEHFSGYALAFVSGLAVQMLLSRAYGQWRRRNAAALRTSQQLLSSLVRIRHLSARVGILAREYLDRVSEIDTRLANLPPQGDDASTYVLALSDELREVNEEVESRICPLLSGLQQQASVMGQQLVSFASRFPGSETDDADSTQSRNSALQEFRLATLDLVQRSPVSRLSRAREHGLAASRRAIACSNSEDDSTTTSGKSSASIQYIAAYRPGDLLCASNFRPVGCNNLSADGFSFWADSPPVHKYVAVRSAPGEQLNYTVAEIVCDDDDEPVPGKRCLVECHFVDPVPL